MTDTNPHQVAIRDADPGKIMATVNNVAGACKAIVQASVMNIQGKSYIRVEGWQAIAAAHGCISSVESVDPVPDGIRAIATIRRLTDGAILGNGEGFVGDDEAMWVKRPLYARRAMAQTRAISRACRGAFAHVVVAMNAGFGTNYSTTPAEEVPAEGFPREKTTSKGETVKKKPEWNKDQIIEAGGLRQEIEKHAGGKERVDKLWKEMLYDPPAYTIDALRDLQKDQDEIANELLAQDENK